MQDARTHGALEAAGDVREIDVRRFPTLGQQVGVARRPGRDLGERLAARRNVLEVGQRRRFAQGPGRRVGLPDDEQRIRSSSARGSSSSDRKALDTVTAAAMVSVKVRTTAQA